MKRRIIHVAVIAGACLALLAAFMVIAAKPWRQDAPSTTDQVVQRVSAASTTPSTAQSQPTANSPAATATATATATPTATPRPPAEGSFTCQLTGPAAWRTCLFTENNTALKMTFYLYVPGNYDPNQKYPLVLLLHGGGEAANSTSTPAQNRDRLLKDPYAEVWGPGYPGPYDPGVQKHWSSFVVVPQVMAPNRFVNVKANVGSYTMAPQPSDSLRMTKEILDTMLREYPAVDPGRLYITGLSMGGYGAWEAIERWPNFFAAAAPISAAGDPTKAALLKTLPIWAFAGSDDPIVPVSGSRDMIAAIKAAGGQPRYTEYAGEGHGVWVNVYSILGRPSPTPDFYTWLFGQRRTIAP